MRTAICAARSGGRQRSKAVSESVKARKYGLQRMENNEITDSFERCKCDHKGKAGFW